MTSFKWSISLAYFAKINGNSMEFQVKVNGFSMVFKWVNGFCKWKTNDFKWSENKWKNNEFSMDFIVVNFFVIRSNIYKHWLCLFSTKRKIAHAQENGYLVSFLLYKKDKFQLK